MAPTLIHNRPGSGVLRECLAQARYVAAAPPARKKALVGKLQVAATVSRGRSRQPSRFTPPASPKRHQPLKSTVHTSLDCCPRRPLLRRPPATGPPHSARLGQTICSRTHLKLLSLGACPCRRWYNGRRESSSIPSNPWRKNLSRHL
jgi:hypothetical protein